MGNCWGTPVKSSHSPTTTRPSDPASSKNNSNEGMHPGPGSVISSGMDEVFINGQILPTPNLRIFTFEELKTATRNFRRDTVLGEGGFGTVFKGWVDEKTFAPAKAGSGMVIAVKKLNSESLQGRKEWESEVNYLGRLSHPNIVKLLGYCCQDEELLLVYEFMSRGSLERHLFRRGPAFQPLSWSMRLNIAIGAARALEFLHSDGTIYRDFKASNILLDSNYNVKICDFGLARDGPQNGASHVSTGPKGTYGYAAPEYVATGRLCRMSDVYSFGVVWLEMLSGLRVLDLNRPTEHYNLVKWAKPYLSNRRKLLSLVMDEQIEGQYPSKGAVLAAKLTVKCLETKARGRPSMSEVVRTLEKIQAIKHKP